MARPEKPRYSLDEVHQRFYASIRQALGDEAGDALIAQAASQGSQKYRWLCEQLIAQGQGGVAERYRSERSEDIDFAKFLAAERRIPRLQAKLAQSDLSENDRASYQRDLARDQSFVEKRILPQEREHMTEERAKYEARKGFLKPDMSDVTSMDALPNKQVPYRVPGILGYHWFSTGSGAVIGVVAARTARYAPEFDQWQASIGVSPAHGSEEDDAEHIADWGAPLTAEQAAGFFPALDLSKYKMRQ